MTTTRTPTWSTVDDETHDLLMLVADEHPATPTEAEDWRLFVQALRAAATPDGLIDPNRLRPMLRGKIPPHKIGALTHRAKSGKLIVDTGQFVPSTDREGRNGGKPARVYRLLDRR